MNPSLDARDVFRNPKRVIDALGSGKIIALIDNDGQMFARVIPANPVNARKKGELATKKTAACGRLANTSSVSKK